MVELKLIEPAGAAPFVNRMKRVDRGETKAKDCEVTLQFGVFFDGTDNNYDRDKTKFGDSNIARLWRSYPVKQAQGVSSLYVPGVGTNFDEIGVEAEGWRGTAFGIGCEARVLYALLKTLEFVNRMTDTRALQFSKEQLNVLCTCNIVTSRAKEKTLLQMGLARGLQELGEDRGARRIAFFRRETEKLGVLLRSSPIRVKNLTIDIFGFSRGAAEARAYASWLHESLVDDKFAGIPFTLRFMGLLDTVASAGVVEMIASAMNKSTGGHSGWARPESLRIPPQVLNCVHFVAMHEIRKNFPVDSIFNGDARLPRLHEFAYPGSHSDVGGGYSPGELGIAAGVSAPIGDAMKLSQIPLNHLFDYAVAAGVPLSKDLAMSRRSHYDPFAVSEKLKADFETFLSINGKNNSTIANWTKIYLAWRWQVRHRYNEVGHVRRAKEDQRLLIDANRKLIDDAERLLQPVKVQEPVRVVKDFVFRPSRSGLEPPASAYVLTSLESEAQEVLREAIAFGMPDAAIANFFDQYVHDSYAGFCASLKEPTGYWRYRKSFQGSDKPMNADLGEEIFEIRSTA
jgi:hypothetical protein